MAIKNNGLPVLLIGKSGSGKSASMRTLVGKNVNVINVIGKPYPFRGKIPSATTDDYQKIMGAIVKSPAQSIVIDDAGYLITNAFMKGHAGSSTGNGIFQFYNKLADNYWNFIEYIKKNAAGKIVYIIMHEDTDENGNVRPKTIGKLLDEKVCIEGMFTIVLRATIDNGKHVFLTQSDGSDVAKTPIDMFANTEIPNDLYEVDKAIREYYGMEPLKESEEK